MATFFMDPVGGNDANDGTTFANRWKTLTNGATAARITAGDVIRLIASPDASSIGSAQWTDNSRTITPTTSSNKLIEECDSGWTASANITASFTTPPKTGSARLSMAPVAAFTTGLAAYKAFGSTQDFSAYRQISFWFQASAAVHASFTVALCSDSVGAVPVDSFSVATSSVTANQWLNYIVDKGSALSSGINSVAIYFDSDPGTTAHRFDNIVACKAPGAADEITHNTLIGKNTGGEPEWYSIDQITDTTILIGASVQSQVGSNPCMPYRGTTESVTTYIRNGILGWLTADRTLNEGGTDGNPITLSGGWNTTDMSTQTGETWLTGSGIRNTMVTSANVFFIKMEKIGLSRFILDAIAEISHGWDVDLLGIIGCVGAFTNDASATPPAYAKFKCRQIWGCGSNVENTAGVNIELDIGRIHGSTPTTISGGAFASPIAWPKNDRIGKIDNNASNGIFINSGGMVRLKNTILQNNVRDVYFAAATGGTLHITNGQLLSTTSVGDGSSAQYEIKETNYAGDPTIHRTRNKGGIYQSQATTTHSAGVAWQMLIVSSTWFSAAPFQMPLASFAVNANKLVTVKCWMRKTHATTITGKLRFKVDALPGVAETAVAMSNTANTWEEVTITCTPTSAGVITVFGECYGSIGDSVYFDDITITQAS